MLEVTGRKIKLNEVFILSRILKDMNCKSYIEYLSRQMARSEKDFKKEIEGKSEKEVAQIKMEHDRNLGMDIFAFVIENIELSKNAFYDLISSYAGIKPDDAENLNLDDVFEIFKKMYEYGLPDVIINIVKKNFSSNANLLKH